MSKNTHIIIFIFIPINYTFPVIYYSYNEKLHFELYFFHEFKSLALLLIDAILGDSIIFFKKKLNLHSFA